MEKYEILYCLITICLSSVAFKITIEDFSMYKIFSVKKMLFVFDGKRQVKEVSKYAMQVKAKALYLHHYKLPTVNVD